MQKIESCSGKESYRERLVYWLQDEAARNFGDYLSDYLAVRLFVTTPRRRGEMRLIGSCLDDGFVPAPANEDAAEPTMTAWAAGLRRPGGLSPQAAQRVEVLAVRGPLTARELGLAGMVPEGDAGLLLPALYTPRRVEAFAGRMVCVPHFHDARSDAEIAALTGAERVLRPRIAASFAAIEAFIDALTSARFVLCGSLHAAIAAAAYGVPFAFWDGGEGGVIDLPFKWQDFAASIGVPAAFQRDCVGGERHYAAEIAPMIRLPRMGPALAAAPYFVRPQALLRVFRLEQARGASSLDDFIAAFDAGTMALEKIGRDAESLLDDWAGRARSLQAQAAANEARLQRAAQEAARVQQRLTIAERRGEELRARLDEAERTVAERDRTVAEREHTIAERDRRIAEAEASHAEALRELGEARQQRDEATQAIAAMKRSSSWRMTAPYRALRNLARPATRALERSDLLTRAVTSPLLLLPYLAYKGDHHGFYRSWRPRSGFVATMLSVQDVVRERLQQRGPLYRGLATFGFAAAARIHESGGVLKAVAAFAQTLFRRGPKAAGAWLAEAAPGRVPARVLAGDAAPEPAGHRILVADYRVPRSDVSAGERATVGILRDLCAFGFEVTFLAKDLEDSPRYAAELERFGVRVVTRRSAAGCANATEYVARHGAAFGAFYLIRVDVAEALLEAARRAAPRARIVFHAPDLYFLREMRAARLEQDAALHQRALQTREREVAMMRRSDHVVVVSPAEVPVLKPFLPETPVSVFPVLYAPVVAAPPPFEDRRHVFFLGGFGHPPNIDAAEWFAKEVWPLVRARLPEAEFHIVGAEAPPSVVALGALPGVRCVGYVPELGPVLASMRVGVAPLRYGAGIKGKVAVTMGAGIPCVCTTIAAEGMGIRNGRDALVADDPAGLAQAIVALYGDAALWRRLSRRGQALVEDRFGDAANRAALLEVLDAARAIPLELYCEHWANATPVPLPQPDDDDGEAEIDVSIIVPVYDKWPLTRACLSSIVGTSRGSGVRYEVIVADDGSSDETVRVAEFFPGVRHVRTPRNLGFLRNCNHAAAQARGRHLLLLNNDTVVMPGWLRELYETIEADPSAAIVGSKMLYPGGQIQEAGGGLLADASGLSIGRWLDPKGHLVPGLRDHPAFAFERETDYISGASILVRRSFWEAVGGFDERYQPAYCEDSDLAMAARARGLRVVYQPASEIVHFEHQTYADEASGHRALMARHHLLLHAKWAEAFRRDHLPPGSAWYRVAAHGDRRPGRVARERRRNGRFNVLYFSPFPSHPGSHGNQATIQQFARRFQALGHRVHFVLLESAMYGEQDLAAMRAAWDSMHVLPNRCPMVADGRPIPFDGWYEEGLGEAIAGLCGRLQIDVVFCSYVFQSQLLEFVPAHVLKVIDTHDKMGERYEMLRANGQPLEFFSCSAEEEGAYLRRADVVVARREEEARYFDAVSGRASAVVVPHFEAPRFVDRHYGRLARVGVVASANRINLALVEELLRAIERRLDGAACPFVVEVAGQVNEMVDGLPPGAAALFKRPWVRLLGFVPDIAAFYAAADVVVSPVTMGTGINVKTVQALAFGVPLLSTAWGTKGIETDEPLHRHADLDALAASLFALAGRPAELQRLAAASRRCYEAFLRKSLEGFDAMLRHPKLRMAPEVDAAAAPQIARAA